MQLFSREEGSLVVFVMFNGLPLSLSVGVCARSVSGGDHV